MKKKMFEAEAALVIMETSWRRPVLPFLGRLATRSLFQTASSSRPLRNTLIGKGTNEGHLELGGRQGERRVLLDARYLDHIEVDVADHARDRRVQSPQAAEELVVAGAVRSEMVVNNHTHIIGSR